MTLRRRPATVGREVTVELRRGRENEGREACEGGGGGEGEGGGRRRSSGRFMERGMMWLELYFEWFSGHRDMAEREVQVKVNS